MSYEFLIFTAGRAGSHLLATLLNSHPDIACEGEFSKVDSIIDPDELSGSLSGCILPFTNREMLGRFKKSKVIHMVRDPDTGAESYLQNVIRYRLRKAGQEIPLNPDVTAVQIQAWAMRLREIQRESRRLMNGRTLLEITYDELTGGENIDTMPTEISDRVCDFLGVAQRTLTTEMRKRES